MRSERAFQAVGTERRLCEVGMYLDRLQCSRESSVAGGSEGRSGRCVWQGHSVRS